MKETNAHRRNAEKSGDRMYIEPSDSPKLVIKTNLDPDSTVEENPYREKNEAPLTPSFKEYFDET
ncbi:hypothetical protein [Bacillus massiliglaciei]|uniref:hypothetical protein n=1 Tax=Bacillus massiliglaciei TaxID=1816693 RepID=UPI000A62CFD8|nr:hypothetical protein [Bacillus massiliglaciei]